MEEFKLKWRRKKKLYEKTLEKEVVIAVFNGIIKGFSEDNEISKKLVGVIPDVKEMYIDWDSTADINSVYYKLENGDEAGIPIIHHHKIVWAILNGYCMAGDEIVK